MNKLTKLFALLLVVALASTTFYVGTQLNSTVSTLGDEQNVSPVDLESPLEFDPLHVSLNGESKLHVNESSTYQAVVSGGSGNFGYVWSVDPLDGKTVFVSDGDTCSFMFVVATVDPYVLTVEVTDLVSGNKDFDSFTVYDPYTLPDLYLEASLANFDYRVKGDGVGWFFVSEGVSGKTLFSSTVLSDAVDYALASAVSGNILLDGVYFNYSLTVPVNVSVTESVDGLTRVFVNSVNSQGSPYTVSVDSVHPTYYLVQDGMGRFIDEFTSTNLTALQDTVLGATTSGEIRLNEVAFDLALMNSIPEDVQVVESVNSRTRTFINSADSLGSPYTVSVEGVNYFAQDRENRICQTSTNIATVFQNILASDTSISFGSGLFTFDWVANLTSGSVYPYSVIANGLSRISITGTGQTNFKVNDNQAISLLLLNNCNNITIKGINWDGNKANNPVTGASHLYGNTIMTLGTTTALTVEGCYFANVIGHPISNFNS